MHPFVLNDADRAWLVEAGAVDVFAVAIAAHVPYGPRHHAYRITAGHWLLGLDSTSIEPGWGFIAAPVPGTSLREQRAEEVPIAAADAWVGATARGARDGVLPRDHLVLEPGTPQNLVAGTPFGPLDRFVFLKIEAGEAALFGYADVTINLHTPLFPMRSDVWARALSPCRVQIFEASGDHGEREIRDGLQAWHQAILRLALLRVRAVDAASVQRIERRAEAAAEHMHEGLSAFAGLLSGDKGMAFASLDDAPLVAACQLIGRHSGIQFISPPRAEGVKTPPIEAIADAAYARYRKVVLRGEWWQEDGGHLLGFIKARNVPVALIRGPRGYSLHDPSEHTIRAVDEGVAQTLLPFAWQFFRGLPPFKLGPSDLLRFAAFDIRRDLLQVLTLGILIGIVGMFVPIASGFVFDTLIPSGERWQTVQLAGALLAAALASAMFTFARSIATLRIETRADTSLQAALWDRVLNLPVPFFRRYATGDLAMRINGVNTIRQALSGATMGTILSSMFALMNVGVMFWYSRTLAFTGIAIAAAAALLALVCGWIQLRYQRQMAEAAGRLSGIVLEYMRGVAKLRVTASESRAFANWSREFVALKQLSFRAGKVRNVTDVAYTAFSTGSDMVIFSVVALVVLKDNPGTLSIGQFIAFTAAFGQVLGAVVGLANTALGLLNLVPVYERARPVLETIPETDAGKAHPGELQGTIEVAHACHRYSEGGPPVLDHVSFSIRRGGFIAVVGPSGSGKSTLLRCLLGFEKLTSGSIFYDNRNLADLDARAVRRQIGVVLQHGQLITGDIYTNIVGTNEHSLEDAWEAARRAGMEEDIHAMPMGMHTLVSEGGSTLSGGQRQRIMIARALVSRPRIVFLDEATSALDNRTQAVVSRSLAEMHATRIVIAHRLSTVIQADRIFVMDKGRIVQTGNYKSLMAEPGLFRELAARQLA